MLGPLLFLVTVNDLKSSTKFLEPIMFVNDTNYFLAYKNVDVFIKKCNQELKHSNELFDFNKLSLTHEPTNFTIFHEERARDNTPLKLTTITLNNFEIKRETPMKLLGVIRNENISCKLYIGFIQNEMSKNIRTL